MAELAQGLGLDLADTLARDVELLADLLQGPGPAVVQTEAQAQHLLLALREGPQDLVELLLEQGEGGGVRGDGHVVVLNEITEVAVLLLADGRLEGDRLLGDLDDLTHALDGDVHLVRDLLGSGFAAQLLQELSAHAHQLVDGLDHVDRDPDGPGLVRDGPGDGLADPPGCIGGELEALAVVEFLDGLDQAQVALLDQVQEEHAAADIALGNADDQTQVGLGQTLLGILVTGLHALGEGDLLLCGQERNLADLLEIHAHRILDIDTVRDREVDVFQILLFGVLIFDRLQLAVRDFLFVCPDNVDIALFKDLHDQVILFLVKLQLVECLGDLLILQDILFVFSPFDQLIQFLLEIFSGLLIELLHGHVLHLLCF